MPPREQSLNLTLPVGSRVLVVGDLLLGRLATASSNRITSELAAAVDLAQGPGVVVLNGGFLDLLGDPVASPSTVLAAHPQLVAALCRFGEGADRTVVVVPGAADRQLAWDAEARAEVAAFVPVRFALALDLGMATAGDPAVIHVEAGTRFDERFRFADPPSPLDSPLGVHLVGEVVPTLRGRWADGVSVLADVGDLPRFVTSRLAYRRVGPWSWLVLVPFLLAFGVKIPLAGAIGSFAAWPDRIGTVAVMTTVDLLLVAAVLGALVPRAWRLLAVTDGDGEGNEAARAEARSLAGLGVTGLVVSHGRRPELQNLGSSFFAATGPACELVRERPARLGLPPVFRRQREAGWLEIESGASLHVRLVRGEEDAAGVTLLERLASRRRPSMPTRVVGQWPGDSWPARVPALLHRTRVRRRASAAILVAGLLDLVSAFTPPLEDRLSVLLRLVPLAVPQVASALVAVGGFGLLALAWGVRRGQRTPWRIAVALLAGSVVLHLVKGADVEEAAVSGFVAWYLVRHREAFTTRSSLSGLSRGLARAASVLVVAHAVSVFVIEAVTLAEGRRLGYWTAWTAAAERLVGIQDTALPDRLDDFLTPSLAALGLGIAGWLLALAVRPALGRRPAEDTGARAHELVGKWGSGTLDYFALRADKQLYFGGSSLVAYAVHHSVCLVSPDPIGPPWEREEIWRAFRAFTDEHGWTVAVLGAGEPWLETYRDFGMQRLYVGDEAVVDVRHFSLDGGRHKALRQAVNRVANRGYTMTFVDPSAAGPELRASVRAILAGGRRGDAERGFSMTLGRLFDDRDEGLLLAVCHAPDGHVAAFCQYVPAPGIGGYSLDLMRRESGEHPNGLLDFVIVRTIEHLRDQGNERLGLNFATMRGVLAGERATGPLGMVQRWVLRRMSSSMQIESLWRFNAKFDPLWQPRYVVYDTVEHLVPTAFAIARAESFWELPLVGRLLRSGRP
ncbi:MAG: bifunctional lysylphosphatidylglycerol flippase/synthetase MprF [Acidimicrobiia bacterium]